MYSKTLLECWYLLNSTDHQKVVEHLISYGANIKAENKDKATALHIASAIGKYIGIFHHLFFVKIHYLSFGIITQFFRKQMNHMLLNLYTLRCSLSRVINNLIIGSINNLDKTN